MFNLQTGMTAHTKKIDIHVGGSVLSYSAPRGKSFVVLLLGDEKPSGDPDIGIQAEKWLNDRGWFKKE